MTERKITLEDITPVEFSGVNDVNLDLIKRRFPQIKIVARGETIKIAGEEEDLNQLEMVINIFTAYFVRHGELSENAVVQMLAGTPNTSEQLKSKKNNDVLFFGHNGIVIKARTDNQRKLVDSIMENTLTFAIGPAGTGKTYTAVTMAVRALKNKEVRKIILTRPAVEAGENLGFLPGDLKEKLDPYLQPLYDALEDMIAPEKLAYYLQHRIIQIAPLAFMRGRTLDNAFVILDEAQNTSENQLKMFLTRMGASAKFVVTGDITQIDLPKNQPSGLPNAIKLLENIEGVGISHLTGKDNLRHSLVQKIIDKYDTI